MDCIILAGSGENYHGVSGSKNKAFLTIKGKPLVQIVLEQVVKVKCLEHIHMVGPKGELEAVASRAALPEQAPSITCFEQKNDLIENILHVISASELGRDPHRVVLILPSDIPLVTAQEIEQFIDRADMDRYDLVSGLTTEQAMRRFYPREGKPGVVMTYFYFQEGNLRINNLHLARPSAVGRGDYVRKTYALRYQKKVLNIVRMAWHLFLLLFRAPGAFRLYARMQVSRVLHERGMARWARRLKTRSKLEDVEALVSRILNTRFGTVITDFGSSAMDVDNEPHYEAIRERYDEWRSQVTDPS